MFSAIAGYLFGNSSNQKAQNNIKENKPLKSDISNNNLDSSKNKEKKRTIIKGEKNKFDFTEEYDEDEPKSSSLSTSENSSSNENKKLLNENIELDSSQKINNDEYWRMAHCVYVKNSLININTLNYVPFIKEKKKKGGIFSYIGFGSDTSLEETKYLVGFDENFIYMIDLSKKENNDDNDAMKTIGNHYDITKISNLEVDEDKNKNKILVTILFVLDNDVDNFISKIKKFYFEKPNALKFLNLLKAYLNNYKIKINYNDKVFGNINFNERGKEEKFEKEKIIDTKEIKIDDKKGENEENNEKIDDDDNDVKNEEKKEKENKIEEKQEINDEEEKQEEEVFTSKNVEEQHIEKENKNLIDI